MHIETLRAKLESFVRYYVPKGWKEAVGVVDFVPLFTNDELKEVRQGRIPTVLPIDHSSGIWLRLLGNLFKMLTTSEELMNIDQWNICMQRYERFRDWYG